MSWEMHITMRGERKQLEVCVRESAGDRDSEPVVMKSRESESAFLHKQWWKILKSWENIVNILPPVVGNEQKKHMSVSFPPSLVIT